MTDLTTELRRAVLTRMKATGTLTAIVPAASIHSGAAPATPAWPFVKWGVPSSVPREATCLRGEDVRVTLHAFARARLVSGAKVETGEDHIGRILGAMKAALHNTRLDLPSGYVALRLITSRRIIDGSEADDWHGILEFRARIVA